MGDTSDSVYRHYLMKRYWERKSAYELPKFLPYEDAYIDLEQNPYSNTREPKTQVNDAALDSMINRVLTNQAISLAEGKEHHEDFESNPLGYQSEKIPGMYKVQSKSFSDVRLPKKRSGSKNTRRPKARKPAEEDERYSDLPEGSEISHSDGVPMVTLSIDMLRRYMYIEVEARVRYINDYYARQWDEINKEKLASYAELIIVKERNTVLLAELSEMEKALMYYKQLCSHLEDKVEHKKEANRRRRQAKKQRKSDTPSVSQSDTVSCAQAQKSREAIGKDTDVKPEASNCSDIEDNKEDIGETLGDGFKKIKAESTVGNENIIDNSEKISGGKVGEGIKKQRKENSESNIQKVVEEREALKYSSIESSTISTENSNSMPAKENTEYVGVSENISKATPEKLLENRDNLDMSENGSGDFKEALDKTNAMQERSEEEYRATN